MSGWDLLTWSDGGFDVFDLFAFIAPHEEHAALDVACAAQVYGALDLLHLDAAVHGVENALRTALRADPDAEAAELGEKIEHLFVEAVGA